jgi:hypothetical protein
LGDIVEPALDPGWEEEWLKGWDELLSSDKSEK